MALAGGGAGANENSDCFGCSVCTNSSLLLLHANKVCLRVFGIRSKASFHMYFTNGPRAA